MNLSYKKLSKIADEFGDSFYLLDSAQFRNNYIELEEAFRKIYKETYIAYSYKTNYTPKLCKIVNELGGYAEVVSAMEVELAKRVGVAAEKIIFNGPYKEWDSVSKLLLAGGCVNLDSEAEIDDIRSLARSNPTKTFNIGIRCNFVINDNSFSRFGFDVEDRSYSKAMELVEDEPNIELKELHCHFSSRRLETWPTRTEGMLNLFDNFSGKPEIIDLGGGIFGKMGESLKSQFNSVIPNYDEYAEAVANMFRTKFGANSKVKLVIEPGSALVGDCMKFAAKVNSIKNVRGKHIATLIGSVYNINPTLNTKNLPITVYHNSCSDNAEYSNMDFSGYTCIESDYLYRNYNGCLAVGDYVVFDNAGSYSIVLKPPFIMPNFAVVDCSEYDGKIELVKRRETFDDIFQTFVL